MGFRGLGFRGRGASRLRIWAEVSEDPPQEAVRNPKPEALKRQGSIRGSMKPPEVFYRVYELSVRVLERVLDRVLQRFSYLFDNFGISG